MPIGELHKRKRSKNLALLLVLIALMALFFALTLQKMSAGS